MKRRHSIGALASLGLIGTCAVGGTRADRAASELPERSNAFAWDMYQQLKRADGNLFFSPYSLSSGLAMTSLGAREQTATEIRKSMHWDRLDETLHAAMATSEKLLAPNPGIGSSFKVANSLWGQRGYAWKSEFRVATQRYYGSSLAEVDFRTAESAELARASINAWVAGKTDQKIKDLLPKDVLEPIGTSTVRLVLVNAVWFKALWASPFIAHATTVEQFHVSPGVKVNAPLMSGRAQSYFYGETDALKLLELPYQGGQFSMVILLPKDRFGLQAMEASLNAGSVQRWLGTLELKTNLQVLLPKFRVRWSAEMSEQLMAIGMRQAFDERKADFSGMNGAKPGQPEALFISDVFHSAFVEVAEAGTEAAAATAVIMRSPRSFVPFQAPQIVFRADHPFVYLIRDRRSGQVLFIGRLVRPE